MQMREVSKEDLPDIYCDMDQVLCNFMKGADAVDGSFVNTDKEERDGRSIKQKVSGQILSGCQVRKECISSSKSMIHTFCLPLRRDPTSKTGKLKWLARIQTFLSLVFILSSSRRNNSMQRQMGNQIS